MRSLCNVTPYGRAVGSFASSTVALSTAGNAAWEGLTIIGTGKTLSTVRAYINAVTGTLIAGDVTLSLYADSGATQVPTGAAIETKNCSSAPTAAGWYEWTGFSTALTFGTRYWLVWKNANAAPTTNFPTMQRIADFVALSVNGRKNSTNSGSTWSSLSGTAGAFRIAWSDGTYDGWPLSAAAALGSGNGVYAARECGSLMTIQGSPRVVGAWMTVAANTGTPTGTPRLRIYSGSGTTPALIATSGLAIQASTTLAAFFANDIILPPGAYRLTLSETTQSDASTDRMNCYGFTVDNNAPSKALMPFGSQVLTYTTDGITFTDDDTQGVPCGFLLDAGNEFRKGQRQLSLR